jgi:hypothetical protein
VLFRIAPLREQLALLWAGGVDFDRLSCCFALPATLCKGHPATRLRADLSINFDLMAGIILCAQRVSSPAPGRGPDSGIVVSEQVAAQTTCCLCVLGVWCYLEILSAFDST